MYDPEILRSFARQMYFIAFMLIVLTALVGAITGAASARALGGAFLGGAEPGGGGFSPTVITLLGALLGGTLGGFFGYLVGFIYKFLAQFVLCMLQIEINTRN